MGLSEVLWVLLILFISMLMQFGLLSFILRKHGYGFPIIATTAFTCIGTGMLVLNLELLLVRDELSAIMVWNSLPSLMFRLYAAIMLPMVCILVCLVFTKGTARRDLALAYSAVSALLLVLVLGEYGLSRL